jgi:inhibitor of KinA sporulation pathway (predicted exonuclease)
MINKPGPVKKKRYGGGKIFVGGNKVVAVPTVDIIVCSELDEVGPFEPISVYAKNESINESSNDVVIAEPDSSRDDVLSEPVEEPKVTEYFVVVDLEATCFEDRSIPREDLEIIEIGAAIMEKETLTIIDKFSIFCKPEIHTELSSFCKDLTHISQSDVDEAPPFSVAFKKFIDWMNSFEGHKTLCSWGFYDKAKLLNTCETQKISYPFDKDHLNVKELFSSVKDYKRKYSLSAAMRKLRIDFKGTPHRGVDDALNTAEVLSHLLRLSNKS